MNKKLWIGFSLLLVLSVLAEFSMHKHAYFSLDKLFGFYAWYAFLSCVGLVLVAKVLGKLLKRPYDYYQKPE